MTHKLSMMGSSRFELDPNGLDRRREERQDLQTSAYADVLAAIEQSIAKYSDGDVVTREGLTEWLENKLVSEFIRRRN